MTSANALAVTGLALLGTLALLLCNEGLRNSSRVSSRVASEERARVYLQRVLAVTGATQVYEGYALNSGSVQFRVCDRFVRRLQNPDDPGTSFGENLFLSRAYRYAQS